MKHFSFSVSWLAGLFMVLSLPAAADDVGPLVDIDWVRTNGDRDDVVILDIRSPIDGGSADSFARGHIPGAVHSDYVKDGWRTVVDGVVGQVPSAEHLEALFGGLGIGNDSTVVVVPAGVSSTDFGSAARVYWTFKYAGHDKVTILDGGYRAWLATPGNPIETGTYSPEPRVFDAELRPELRIDSAGVEAALDRRDVMLLDGRPANQFNGLAKHKAARAAGHIPGAAHHDQDRNFDQANGRLFDLDRLRKLLPAGLDDTKEVVSYCNTGHWAAVNWFVLSELAGRDNVRLYDGSMVAWTRNPDRPLQ